MVTTTPLRQLDFSLGPARMTVRITRTPDCLVIAMGHGGASSGDPFTRNAWDGPPLTLPADAVPKLRAALDALEDSGP
ncbi:MAG: hypothetical protein WD960_14915 [Gemmatimonadota bacterium]